jgi:hypothetical protein
VAGFFLWSGSRLWGGTIIFASFLIFILPIFVRIVPEPKAR